MATWQLDPKKSTLLPLRTQGLEETASSTNNSRQLPVESVMENDLLSCTHTLLHCLYKAANIWCLCTDAAVGNILYFAEEFIQHFGLTPCDRLESLFLPEIKIF